MRFLSAIERLAVVACLAAAGVSAASDFELLMVEVSVNGAAPAPSLVLRGPDDDYWIEEQTIDAWRINGHRPAAIEFRGMRFLPVAGFEGSRARFDPATVSLNLTIPPRFIKGQVLNAGQAREFPASSAIGIYADYDLAYQDVAVDDSRLFTGLLEPTLFSPAGVFANSVLYRNGRYDNDPDDLFQADDDTDYDDGFVRLQSTWFRDDPVRLRSLRLGDSILAPGMLGSAARFGGVQLATNFDTRPDLVTFPLPQAAGEALMASSVDLFVDGRLASTADVEAGPFRFDNLPVVTGAGQISLVTRDLTGREQVVVTDFYASQRLLRSGLSEYSYSAGAFRRNYGVDSNDYGNGFLSGFHRYGLNDSVTVEGQAQWSRDIGRLAGGVTWALPRIGVTTLGVGVSHADGAGSAAEALVAHEYQTRRFRITMGLRYSGQDYRQINDQDDAARVKLAASAGAGFSLGERGAVSAGFAVREYHDSVRSSLFSLNYSKSIGRNWSLASFGTYVDGDDTDYALGISVTRFLGARRSATTDLSLNDGQWRGRGEVRANAPRGPGFGYRVAAGRQGDDDLWEADLAANSRVGNYRLETDHDDDGLSWRASAAGSAAWIGGMPFLAREINDAFAVVRVNGFEGVRVYLDNQEIGRTDGSGRVLLPGLRPFEPNRVSIDLEDVPLNARIDRLQTVVTPYAGAGVLADFPASEGRDAMLRLRLPDGLPAPQGGRVALEGAAERFPVGIDGAVYLRGVVGQVRGTLHWRGPACGFTVEIPADGETVPDLGDVICRDEQQP